MIKRPVSLTLLILSLTVATLAALYFSYPNYNKAPQIILPPEFKLTLDLQSQSEGQNSWTKGQADFFVKHQMVRTEFRSDSFQRITLHRDGNFYVLKPSLRKLSLTPNFLHWLLNPPKEDSWEFLEVSSEHGYPTETYKVTAIRNNQRTEARVCINPELHFPVHVKNDQAMEWHLKSLDPGKQDEALFEVPTELKDRSEE